MSLPGLPNSQYFLQYRVN